MTDSLHAVSRAVVRCSSGVTGGAIASVELAGDIDWALARLGVHGVMVGSVRRRSVPVGPGVRDDAVVGRWTADRATVMTHGGAAVVEGFLTACEQTGVARGDGAVFVEALDEVEHAALETLARAQSPAAVDLLLDQPRRWRSCGATVPCEGPADREVKLRRLIEPALVVAVGPPNIGKSSLLNALAGRSVSVVADEPGTTRDHVGVLIDLAGVVVRWVDTPGIGETNLQEERGDEEIQAEAQRLALDVASRADVLVVCSDAGAAIDAPPSAGRIVRVGLRSDLGRAGGVEVAMSVRDGEGIAGLVDLVREAVVPRRYLEDGLPWAFWTRWKSPHLRIPRP